MEPKVPALTRDRQLPEALDFKALLEIGIRRVQQLSGDLWTDYNAHDPGVTILEQACYALVDIAYRASHPVEDLIETVFAESGKRDARMAVDFPLPHRALTTAPVTPEDFTGALVDQFPQIRGVWFTQEDEPFAADETTHPVTKVEVLLHGDRPDLLIDKEISDFLQGIRLLGHPIDKVKIIQQEPYRFEATIEALPGYEPDDLIAAVLHRVDLELCLPIQFRSRADFAEDWTTDALFEGPLLRHGVLADWNEPRQQPPCDATWLRRIIVTVEGVASVSSVYVRNPEPRQPGRMLTIDMVNPLELIKAVKVKGPNETPVAGQLRALQPENVSEKDNKVFMHIEADLKHRMNSLMARNQRAMRESKAALERRLARAKIRRRIGEYRSIQHGFPGIYNLQESTPAQPELATDKEQQILNLRGYLALLEQPLADLLQQLLLMPDLLSAGIEEEDRPGATYAAGNLGIDLPTAPPEFQKLLTKGATYNDTVLTAVSRSDPDGTRYEQFLDHLLARHDEAFANEELYQFERPTEALKLEDIEKRIRYKQAFLRELVAPEAETTAQCEDIGLGTHRGSAKVSSKTPCVTALARRIQLKTLLNDPPLVLEHHLLSDIAPSKNQRHDFFVLDAPENRCEILQSIALSVTTQKTRLLPNGEEKRSPASGFVFLHDTSPLPKLEQIPDRLAEVISDARMIVRQDWHTGQTWHVLCAPKGGPCLALLSPMHAAREPMFDWFENLNVELDRPDTLVQPILYPTNFGTQRISIIAENRQFDNTDADKAHAVLIRKTVMDEAPIMLEPTVITSSDWPQLPDKRRNSLHFHEFEAFSDAVKRLISSGEPKRRDEGAIRIMRTIAQAAFQDHINALDRVVIGK